MLLQNSYVEVLTCKVIEFGAGALGIYIGLDNLMRVELP